MLFAGVENEVLKPENGSPYSPLRRVDSEGGGEYVGDPQPPFLRSGSRYFRQLPHGCHNTVSQSELEVRH